MLVAHIVQSRIVKTIIPKPLSMHSAIFHLSIIAFSTFLAYCLGHAMSQLWGMRLVIAISGQIMADGG